MSTQFLSYEDYDNIRSLMIEMFLSVKVRSNKEITGFDPSQFDEEREALSNTSIEDLIGYVKTSIEILMGLKTEEYLEYKNQQDEKIKQETQSSARTLPDPPKEYEEVIQKLEGDIRKHIRIEQQMKIHSDNLTQKLEEKEKEVDQIQAKIEYLKQDYRREIKNMVDQHAREIEDMKTHIPFPKTSKSFMDRRKCLNNSKLETTQIK